MTKDERLDRQIEACLVTWLERIRHTYYIPHNRPQPKYEQRPFSELKTGDWVYSSGGPVPLGVLSRCKTMVRTSGRSYYLPAQFFVRTGIKTGEACECEHCAIYRLCFFPDTVS